MSAENLTLVVGGTGKTGRRVAERLHALNLPVRSVSRSSQPPFDWEQPSTWADALRDVRRVYLTYYPDLSMPAAPAAIRAFTEAAAQSGVRHIVVLSGRGEPEAAECEAIIQASGLDWTVLRASWFFQNFDEGYMLDGLLSGELALPVGAVREPFIDADDIADVAVAALTQPGHTGRVYELTGPRLLTFAEAVDEIARASGRAMRFVTMSMADYRAALAAQGLPEDYAWLFDYLFTTVLDGRNASLTGDVAQVLGREARDIRAYARETAAAGAWSGEPAAATDAVPSSAAQTGRDNR